MKSKVFYHRSGNELSLKTRVPKGVAWLDPDGLHVEGTEKFTIAANDLVRAELFRLHGLGRVIQIDYRGGRLYLAVVRLVIGQFAFINFFWTGQLQAQLSTLVRDRS